MNQGSVVPQVRSARLRYAEARMRRAEALAEVIADLIVRVWSAGSRLFRR